MEEHKESLEGSSRLSLCSDSIIAGGMELIGQAMERVWHGVSSVGGLTAIAPFASTQVYLHQLSPANDDGAS